MRILVLGNNYSAKEFCTVFSKNINNMVFSSFFKHVNYIELISNQDIIEFCDANEINFVLITDEKYINQELIEPLCELNLGVFSPSVEAVEICSSKAYAKRFLHKNKIKTPKFLIAEKNQIALEYIKTAPMPLAIKPDCHSTMECTQFCETMFQAQKIINNLFANGNKKIIIEDYIEGKNITVWTISDGFSAKIAGICAKYQNNAALWEPNFINNELKSKIQNEYITPLISAMSSEGEEYIGILGFDFITDKNNELYLLGFNSFFDDISTDFFTKGMEIDWLEVFDSTLIGDVFLKYDFNIAKKYMLTLRQNDEIEFISANTESNLKKYIEETVYDDKEYKEAKKIWQL